MACSLASRFALAETGLPHEVAIVRTSRGEQRTEAYRRINPRGKVPALETEAGVLTESTAILPFIADLAPEKALFPASGFERAEAQAWLSYLSSTLHVALSSAMFPMDGCDGDQSREAALSRLTDAFAELDRRLDGRDHLLERFSVCDLYLAVFLLWRAAPAFAGRLPAFPNLDRFQQNLFAARPNLAMMVADEMKLRMEA
jgi:glutathione S-transferase